MCYDSSHDLPPQIKAFLSGVPVSGMLVLDMYSDVSPVWNRTEGFFGYNFVWNMRHNIAGRTCVPPPLRLVFCVTMCLSPSRFCRGLYGRLPEIATLPAYALIANVSIGSLKGLGVSADGIEVCAPACGCL